MSQPVLETKETVVSNLMEHSFTHEQTVELVNFTENESIVILAARTSTNRGLVSPESDRALLRFLLRNRHTSPFEMITMTFLISCPLYVRSQIMRHRTASYNELSRRYTSDNIVFHIPEKFRSQGTGNRQQSVANDELTWSQTNEPYETACRFAYHAYTNLLKNGVCREQARAVLPQCTMTKFYMSLNLHNLMHFLKLRTAPDAQAETVEIAVMMEAHFKAKYPVIYEAYCDYIRNAVTISSLVMNKDFQNMGKSEAEEARTLLAKISN